MSKRDFWIKQHGADMQEVRRKPMVFDTPLRAPQPSPSLREELTRIAIPLVIAFGICVILANVKQPEVKTPPPQVSLQTLAKK